MTSLDELARRKTRAQELAWRRERDHNVAETRSRFLRPVRAYRVTLSECWGRPGAGQNPDRPNP